MNLIDCLYHGGVSHLVSTWLGSVVDLFHLALTCKEAYDLYGGKGYNEILKRNLGYLVSSFGFPSLEHFNRLLACTGLCLSGSLLLQGFLGENWEGSDMDLYLSFNRNARRYVRIIQMELFKMGYEQKYSWRPYNNDSICVCVGFTRSGKTVQVIVSAATALDTIIAFDYGFLSNKYWAFTARGRLETQFLVWRPERIINRESRLRGYHRRKLDSIIQWVGEEHRGDTNAIANHMRVFVHNCMARMRKYTARGFAFSSVDLERILECNDRLDAWFVHGDSRRVRRKVNIE